MKKIILFALTISSILITSCGPSKPLSPEKQAALDAQIKLYTQIFEDQSFVLEANTVYSKKGRSFNMNPSTNFVKLDKGEGVLQLSFNQIVGWNGVGGITLEGDLKNYKINKGDGTKMPSVQFDMNGTLGWATVRINVNSSGMATATVDAGTSGNRITFAGPLKQTNESGVYQGSSLF